VAAAVARPLPSPAQFTPFIEHQANDPNGPGSGNCRCDGGAGDEPFTDDGGRSYYTRADVENSLGEYCLRNGFLFP